MTDTFIIRELMSDFCLLFLMNNIPNCAMRNTRGFWRNTATTVRLWLQRFNFHFIVIVFVTFLVVLFQKSYYFAHVSKSILQLKTKYENILYNKTVEWNSSSLMLRVNHPFSGIAVQAMLPFLDRVHLFNQALHQLRLEHLRKRGSDNWTNISSTDKIQVIGGADDKFLQQLGNFTQIETLFLPWIYNETNNWTSVDDSSNILINKYFEWTADEELCQWIDTPGKRRTTYDVAFTKPCIRDFEKTLEPKSLSLLTLNSKPVNRGVYWPNNGKSYPSHFYSRPPHFAFYLHIINDGIVNSYGEVWSGNLKLVHLSCTYRKIADPPSNIDKIPLYDEVMALSQYWGEGTFHGMIEVIPRISLYIEFLKRNPGIKVLVTHSEGQTAALLAIFGISKRRLVTGTCRAKLVYLPRSTMCGWVNVQEIQVMSMLYRKYRTEHFKPQSRNKVVLIRRSGQRKFAKHAVIESTVRRITESHNLSFSLFNDRPVPSLNETMSMFHSAVLVIAPHGAGLSNVIFSQPGTFVIEGACNPPHVNLCYLRLSNVLGHHWRGLHSKGECPKSIDIAIEGLESDIEKVISFLK